LLSPEFPRTRNFNHIKGRESLETHGMPPRRMIFYDCPEVPFELADPDDREEWDALLALYEENRDQIFFFTKNNVQFGYLVCRIVNTVPESHSSELLRLYITHFELVESLLELGVASKAYWGIERNGSITDGPRKTDGRS
jgi:hypothetical protein